MRVSICIFTGAVLRNLVVSGNRNDPLHENEVEQGDSHGHRCKPFDDDEAGDHTLVSSSLPSS